MKTQVFLIILLFTITAHAGACFKVDSERDTLMPAEQEAAKHICEQEFIKEGAVVSDECDVTYVILHLLLGDSIVVIIEKNGIKKSVAVSSRDELKKAYSQLARAFIKGESTVGSQTERSEKIKSELNFLIMLGYGIQSTKDIGGGLNWTLGLRYDMRFMLIDFEFASGLYNSHGPEYFEFNLIGFKGAYYFQEKSPSSFYIGAGIRGGFYLLTNKRDKNKNGDYTYKEDIKFSGSGIVSVGKEWLRNTSKRFMVQFDAKFPFHVQRFKDESKKYYFPTLTLNVGIGL